MSNFELFRDWFGIIGNGCLLVISVYAFYYTYISKKIIFCAFSTNRTLLKGSMISVVIENKTLSPIVINTVNILAGKSFKIEVRSFDTPLILEPLSAQKITTDPFSELSESIDLHAYAKIKRLRVEVCTSHGRLYDTFQPYDGMYDKKTKNIPFLGRIENVYNGVMLSPEIKYAIHLSLPNGQSQIFYLLDTGNFYDNPFPIPQYLEISNSTSQQISDFVKKHVPPHEGTIRICVDDFKNCGFSPPASSPGRMQRKIRNSYTCEYKDE